MIPHFVEIVSCPETYPFGAGDKVLLIRELDIPGHYAMGFNGRIYRGWAYYVVEI